MAFHDNFQDMLGCRQEEQGSARSMVIGSDRSGAFKRELSAEFFDDVKDDEVLDV
jgi:hypothetical protein